MKGSLFSGVPVDVFIKAVFKFELEDLHLDRWTFSLSHDLLNAYRNAITESAHYRPFMCTMMKALLDYVAAMKKLRMDVHFPCGVYFDSIIGEDIFYGLVT